MDMVRVFKALAQHNEKVHSQITAETVVFEELFEIGSDSGDSVLELIAAATSISNNSDNKTAGSSSSKDNNGTNTTKLVEGTTDVNVTGEIGTNIATSKSIVISKQNSKVSAITNETCDSLVHEYGIEIENSEESENTEGSEKSFDSKNASSMTIFGNADNMKEISVSTDEEKIADRENSAAEGEANGDKLPVLVNDTYLLLCNNRKRVQFFYNK